jgi:hypothetical protein
MGADPDIVRRPVAIPDWRKLLEMNAVSRTPTNPAKSILSIAVVRALPEGRCEEHGDG